MNLGKKRCKRKKKSKIKVFFTMFFVLVIFCTAGTLIQFKKYVLPSALAISEKYAVNAVNNKINECVEKVVSDMNLTSKDFFENTFNNKEQLNYLAVDTILINRVCAETASQISDGLKDMEEVSIQLPVGIFSGIDILSNVGPKVSIKIIQAGDTVVDYETAFEAVGINQINFQIWLNTETSVTVVNPFYEKNINIKRKLMLVNTVFNGEVPSTYLDLMNKNAD